jgi:hypothetical protein
MLARSARVGALRGSPEAHQWWGWWSRSRQASTCTRWWSYQRHRDPPARGKGWQGEGQPAAFKRPACKRLQADRGAAASLLCAAYHQDPHLLLGEQPAGGQGRAGSGQQVSGTLDQRGRGLGKAKLPSVTNRANSFVNVRPIAPAASSGGWRAGDSCFGAAGCCFATD